MKVIDRDTSRIIQTVFFPVKKDFFLDCHSNKGPFRQKNEDFVAAISSPNNENIRFLAICDGMGGLPKGDIASEFVMKQMIEWFINENFENGIDETKLERAIHNTNGELWGNVHGSGTTLSMAITNEDEAVLAHVGDSRVYSIKNSELIQCTKDDTLAWNWFYQNGEGRIAKDMLRYYQTTSYLVEGGCLGFRNCNPEIIRIKDYDGLLITSDGITDILCDWDIERIIRKEQDILNNLLYESFYSGISYPYDDELPFERGGSNSLLLTPIYPGKDNASVILYLKK